MGSARRLAEAQLQLARLPPRRAAAARRAHLALVLLADAVALVAVLVERRVDLLRHRRDVAVAEPPARAPRVVEPQAAHRSGADVAERQGAPTPAPPARRSAAPRSAAQTEERLAQARTSPAARWRRGRRRTTPAQFANAGARRRRASIDRPSISYSGGPASPPFSTARASERAAATRSLRLARAAAYCAASAVAADQDTSPASPVARANPRRRRRTGAGVDRRGVEGGHQRRRRCPSTMSGASRRDLPAPGARAGTKRRQSVRDSVPHPGVVRGAAEERADRESESAVDEAGLEHRRRLATS